MTIHILDHDSTYPFGRYSGQKVGEVCRQNPGYLKWICQNVPTVEYRFTISVDEFCKRYSLPDSVKESMRELQERSLLFAAKAETKSEGTTTDPVTIDPLNFNIATSKIKRGASGVEVANLNGGQVTIDPQILVRTSQPPTPTLKIEGDVEVTGNITVSGNVVQTPSPVVIPNQMFLKF